MKTKQQKRRQYYGLPPANKPEMFGLNGVDTPYVVCVLPSGKLGFLDANGKLELVRDDPSLVRDFKRFIKNGDWVKFKKNPFTVKNKHAR